MYKSRLAGSVKAAGKNNENFVGLNYSIVRNVQCLFKIRASALQIC